MHGRWGSREAERADLVRVRLSVTGSASGSKGARRAPKRVTARSNECQKKKANLAAPPLALERPCRATGLVERVEFGHVPVGEAEVEDVRVLRDSVPMGRLGDHRHLVLNAPAKQYLRRSPTETVGNRHN